jgi:hypothetical protein
MKLKATALLLCSCLWLGIISRVAGQIPANYKQNVTQPSPNAASLGKYGDIPVNLHTGVPNISIPLHTVEEAGLTIPISLSYHAAGIRVQEVASWVGLGWSLNAGGVITRSIQHVPDEGPYKQTNPGPSNFYFGTPGYTAAKAQGYYTHGHTLPVEFPSVFLADPLTGQASSATDQQKRDYNAFQDAALGNVDSEPDIFFFNVGGFSGKFIIQVERDGNGNIIRRTPVFMPRQDMKVEVVFGNLAIPHFFNTSTAPITTPINGMTFIGFVLTMPNGIRYHFGGDNAIEYTGSESIGFSGTNADPGYPVRFMPNAWYLTKVESPEGRFINLEYELEGFSYFDIAPERVTDIFETRSQQRVLRSVTRGCRLRRIIASNEIVEFAANTTREDLSRYDVMGASETTNYNIDRYYRLGHIS